MTIDMALDPGAFQAKLASVPLCLASQANTPKMLPRDPDRGRRTLVAVLTAAGCPVPPQN
jgi:hypothetical protein